MIYLLCLLLILSPIKFTVPDKLPYLSELERTCKTMQIGTEWSSSFNKAVASARYQYRQLRHAPSAEESSLLPEHWYCERMEQFYNERVNYIEKQVKLYGTYRYDDFSDVLDTSKQARFYWHQCEVATSQYSSFYNKRMALKWLVDQE